MDAKTVEISVEVYNATLEYLSTRPLREVNTLFHELAAQGRAHVESLRADEVKESDANVPFANHD